MDADELAAYVRGIVDTMPPLTDEQRERVTALLRPRVDVERPDAA